MLRRVLEGLVTKAVRGGSIAGSELVETPSARRQSHGPNHRCRGLEFGPDHGLGARWCSSVQSFWSTNCRIAGTLHPVQLCAIGR